MTPRRNPVPVEGNASASPDSESRSGERPVVPDYELIRCIGMGAYGEVWLARSEATGMLRAAKIVWRYKFEDARPFQREFEGIQKFERISREHPSQLALFHIGRNDPAGYFYCVMELADDAGDGQEAQGTRPSEGPEGSASTVSTSNLPASTFEYYAPHTLGAELERGRLPASRVLEIGLALAEALSHLHRNGLVHRDVKPSNVIFVKGRPKLADIGLVTDASGQCSIVGTEGFLLLDGLGTPQADIFALGKTLYEAATGMDRHEFPKLPDGLREWPDAAQVFELNEIALSACASNTRDRYDSVGSMLTELQKLQDGKSIRQQRTWQQRWAMAKGIFLVAAACGLATVSASVLWREAHKGRPFSKIPEAQECYERAVYEMKSGALNRLLQAYTDLTNAVALDPGFVEAHYAMLDLYKGLFAERLPPYSNQLANLHWVTTNLSRLSPGSAKYWTVDSVIKFQEWEPDKAIEEVERAIKLDPNLPRAHGLRAWYLLMARGEADSALQEYGQAKRLEGSDVTIATLRAGPFYSRRDFGGAIEQSKKAERLDTQAPLPHRDLARAYEANGELDKAIDEYEKFDFLCGADSEKNKAWHQKVRDALHGEKGSRGMWELLLDEAERRHPPDSYGIARIHARLGNTNQVIAFLGRAYTNRNGGMCYLLYDDAWDPFRSDPAFQEFVRKMGLRPKAPVAE